MFKLSEFINDFSDKITNNKLLTNPFYTGIIILLFIAVTIFVVSYDSIEIDEDASVIGMIAKGAFFIFIGISGILFLSFNNIDKINKKKYKSKLDAKTANILSKPISDTISPQI